MRSLNPRLLLLPSLAFLTTCSDAVSPETLVDFFLGYCDTPVPAFVAVQNGDGAWTAVTLDANAQATVKVGSKFAVATVLQGSSGAYATEVIYMARSEAPTAAPTCNVAGTNTVNGSISTQPSGANAFVTLGPSAVSLFSATTFQLTGVPSGALDLMARRRTASSIVDKVIVRRAQTTANGGTMTLLDFDGTEAVAPASATVTFTGLGASETPSLSSTAFSATESVLPMSSGSGTSTSGTAYGLAGSQVASTDMQRISATVYPSTGGRGVDVYQRNIASLTMAFAPVLNTPTVTAVTTSPKVLRAQLASQADYGKVVQFYYRQGTGSTSRTMTITTTAGYVGSTPATWDIQPPDLTGVTGYPAAAAFASAAISFWQVYAQNSMEDWFKLGREMADGVTIKWAYHSVSGTTGLLMAPSSLESGGAQESSARRAGLHSGIRMWRR